jgi:hypothetical protein
VRRAEQVDRRLLDGEMEREDCGGTIGRLTMAMQNASPSIFLECSQIETLIEGIYLQFALSVGEA